MLDHRMIHTTCCTSMHGYSLDSLSRWHHSPTQLLPYRAKWNQEAPNPRNTRVSVTLCGNSTTDTYSISNRHGLKRMSYNTRPTHRKTTSGELAPQSSQEPSLRHGTMLAEIASWCCSGIRQFSHVTKGLALGRHIVGLGKQPPKLWLQICSA